MENRSSLENGLKARADGRVLEEIKIYRDILTTEPRNLETIFHLAIALLNNGQIEDSINHFSQNFTVVRAKAAWLREYTGILCNKNQGLLAATLVGLLVNCKIYDKETDGELFDEIRNLISSHYPDTVNKKDIQLLKKLSDDNDWVVLLEKLKQYLAHNPKSNFLLHTAGIACLNLNLYSDSEEYFIRAKAANPTYYRTYNNLGVLFNRTGRFEEAEQSFKLALKIKPNDPFCLNNYGNCLRKKGEHEKAVNIYKTAIEVDSAYAEPYSNLASIYLELGYAKDAEKLLQKAIKLDDSSISILQNMASVCAWKQDLNGAISLLEHSSLLSPNNADILYSLAQYYHGSGDLDTCVQYIKATLNIDKSYSEAYRLYATIAKVEDAPTVKAEIFDALEQDVSNQLYISDLHFALGDIFDKERNYETAAHHYRTANTLRRNIVPYSKERELSKFALIKSQYDKAQDLQSHSESNITPVFIVGMPRSGTSVIEQSLAMHPEVYGAGELDYFKRYTYNITSQNVPITENDIRNMRRLYLSAIDQLPTDATVILDKMPHNFQYLGFIKSLLPEAKIIHAKRDMYQVCVSNFRTCFTSENLSYSNHFPDTLDYYKMYLDIMDFWKDECHLEIFDVKYEDFTTSTEAILRDLFDYIGVEFNPVCLNPEFSNRMVKTASKHQVRYSISTYKSSTPNYVELFL